MTKPRVESVGSIPETNEQRKTEPPALSVNTSLQQNAVSVNNQTQLDFRQTLVRSIGHRLFLLLVVSLGGMGVWSGYVMVLIADSRVSADSVYSPQVGAFLPIVFAGILGGIISLQKRLPNLAMSDLLLLRNSYPYLLLAPLVGGFLATMLYILFLAGLLSGDLFPSFVPDEGVNTEIHGMASIFMAHGESYTDYGKLFFWCFLAGYSESFVTNIIGQFESVGAKDNNKTSGE